MIDLEITDGVAFITLSAPAPRNALWSLRRRVPQ